MNNIKLDILNASYWEHFKFAKDLALILPLDHPKRKRVEAEVDRIQKEILDLNKK